MEQAGIFLIFVSYLQVNYMLSGYLRLLLTTWLFFAASFFVLAEEEAQELQQMQWQFSVTVGHGQYGTLLFDSSPTRLHVLPRWSLYYKRFYLENLDVGFNLAETEHFSLDLSGKQSFDALSVRHNSAEDGLIKSLAINHVKVPVLWDETIQDVINFQRRHLSYLAGITAYARIDDVELRSEWHTDISGVHNGNEWNTLVMYQYKVQSFKLAPSLGVRRLDPRFANYYFGLGYHDTSNLLSVQPGSMWLPSVRLDASLDLSSNLSLAASLKREFYPAEVMQSLFIGSRQHDIWFLGFMYQW